VQIKLLLSVEKANQLGLSDGVLQQLLKLDPASAVDGVWGEGGAECPKCVTRRDAALFVFTSYKEPTDPNGIRCVEYIGCPCGIVYMSEIETTTYKLPDA
jgi:hypothetical protein